jgi:hypothetical protein
LNSAEHHLALREEIITKEIQHDLDKLGIAKTAREEKIRARDEKQKLVQDAENAKMAALYKKHVLNEPESNLVQIGGSNGGIQPAAKPAAKKEEIGSFGD